MPLCPSPSSRPSGTQRWASAGLGWRAPALALSIALAGCSATDDMLSGTAATGAPIAGGEVTVQCRSGAALATTTLDTGAWAVTLTGQTLPCKVRVQAGQVNGVANTTAYHSIATTIGTVNITPLTDLAVAQLAKEVPASWFARTAVADFDAIDTASVTAAVSAVVEALGVKAFLGADNPLTTAFHAKVQPTDRIDMALEALKAAGSHAAVLASAVSAQDLVSAAASFKTAVMAALPKAPQTGGGGDSPGTGAPGAMACTDTEILTSSQGAVRSPTAEELAGYFGNYTGDFDHAGDNQYVTATATMTPDGQVTVKWDGGESTYTGTSFCYDTTIGDEAYGHTLYVDFGAKGKVDLWKKNSKFSGWMKAASGAGSNTSATTSGLEVIDSLNPAACTLPGASGGCGAAVVVDFALTAGQCLVSKTGSSVVVQKAGTVVAEVTLGGDDNIADKAVTSGNYFSFAVREIRQSGVNVLNMSLSTQTGAVLVADGMGDSVSFNCF